MTVQDETVSLLTRTEKERALPEIESEVDIPFNSVNRPCTGPRQSNLSKSDSLDEQITKFKYMTGRKVLFISMGAMGTAALVSIALSVFNIENSMVENVFEVFKLIAMTVLGYIVGSKTK